MKVLAIDPGNVYSAYVILNSKYEILAKGKIENELLRAKISNSSSQYNVVAIEMIASYGMSVGATVFETCVWIGRFMEAAMQKGKPVKRIVRMKVKMNLCHQAKAKDSNITQALKDRFGEVGRKATPGFFFGFKADIWQAMALGVTYLDMLNRNEEME